MFTGKIKAAVVLVFFLSLPLLSGCFLLLGAAAGGAGTAYWYANKLSDEVPADYDRAVSATRQAFASLKLEVEKESRTDEVTQFISTYTDGSKIWVDVRPLTTQKSKVEVRVGLKGDDTAASKIMARIKSRL
ncbi:MAG: DUF3568 family protein [Deltaproteobacteria bacterium]